MQNYKITLINSLKTGTQYQKLRYDQFIAITSDNQFTLVQIRKYLLHKYPSIDLSWKNINDQELILEYKNAKQYILNQRKYWKNQNIAYKNHINTYNKQHISIKTKLDLKTDISQKELFQHMRKYLQQQNEYITANKNLSGINQVIKEYHKHKQFYQNLQKIIVYQYQRSKYQTIYDKQYEKQVIKIINSHVQAIMQESTQYDKLIQVADQYDNDIIMLKSKLRQIFIYYCREHNLKSLSFQERNKYSQMLDLRLYLLYIKDYKYQQINKYKYSLIKVTQIFKKYALNTHHLTFQQFWNIHIEFFQMNIITKTKNQLLEVPKDMIQNQKGKYEIQNQKIKEFKNILMGNRMIQNFKNDYKYQNLKTQFNGLKQSSSMANLGSRKLPQKGTQSSRFTKNSQKYLPSQKGSQILSKNKNFIQSIRQQIDKEQRGIIENKSYKNIAQRYNPEKNSPVNLPKILKMSTQELSSQDIYQSLKKFPVFDYLQQQRRIRSKIGLQEGEDEAQYLKQFFSKQYRTKMQKQQSKIIKRQIKRKQIISQSKVQQHICHKCHPQQFQPYMRF